MGGASGGDQEELDKEEFVSSIDAGAQHADRKRDTRFRFTQKYWPNPTRRGTCRACPAAPVGAPAALRVSGVAEERQGLAVRALVCPAAAVAPLPGQLVEAELLSDGLRLPLLKARPASLHLPWAYHWMSRPPCAVEVRMVSEKGAMAAVVSEKGAMAAVV